DWVRTRIRRVVTYTAVSHSLMHIKIDDLIVAEAAAYLWLTNRSLCTQLISNGYHSRVLVLSGEQVAGSPAEALRAIAKTCELSLTEQQLKWMITHSSVSKYSKDISRPYDVTSRHNEMTELEHCWGAEADAGIDWAMSYAAADNIEDW
ncbi:MAG: hypothetical protein ACRD4L_01755, partial [Pyrinomonadaceae bacterium]